MFSKAELKFCVILFFLTRILSATKLNQEYTKITIGFLWELEQTDVSNEISKYIGKNPLTNDYTIQDVHTFYYREAVNESIQNLCEIMTNGISVIFDLTYTRWDEGLKLLEEADVPIFQIEASITSLLRLMETYLSELTVKDAAFIFQNYQDYLEGLYYHVQESQLRMISFFQLTDDDIKRIKSIRPIPSYYGVFATTENMNNIFNKILNSQLLTRPNKWIIMFLDANYNNFNYHNKTYNITKIYPDKTQNCIKLNMENNCEDAKLYPFAEVIIKEVWNILKRSIEKGDNFFDCNGSLNKTYNDDSAERKNKKQFNSIASALSESKILQIHDNRIFHHMKMIVTITENNSINDSDIAIWEDNHISIKNKSIYPARRYFRIGTTESIPWSYIRRDPITQETILNDEGYPIWEGYCIDLIEKLSEKLSFDYDLVHPNRGTFGERLRDGSWDGLVGDLVTGETDIAIAAMKMTAEREEVIDFIAPYFDQTGISIVIRNAVRQTSLFKFMTVLRVEVWLSILAALIGTAVMIWLLDMYSPYSARNNKEAYPYPCRDFTLKESFWFALTSFTPQGGGEAPKSFSGRILVAAYWLFVVLMLATFTANLAAFLTVERMQTPVQSLEQLARQSRINYTVVEGSDTHKYFINMKFAEDTLYRMWKELTLNATSDQSQYRVWDYPIKEQYGHILLAINSSNPVKDAVEGFRKVNEHENADFAFIHDSAEIKYEISKNCNLTEVGEVFAEQPYAIAIQQGSHLQDEISYAILELQKDRYFEDLTAKFWNHSAKGDCPNSDDNEGITLQSLGGVFIATLFGLGLSMITLAGEVFYYRRKSSTKINVTPIKNLSTIREYKKQPTPPPSFKKALRNMEPIPPDITFGTTFVPTNVTRRSVSFIPVNARNPIHGSKYYYE